MVLGDYPKLLVTTMGECYSTRECPADAPLNKLVYNRHTKECNEILIL